MPEERNRVETDRLARRALRARPRRPGATSPARASPAPCTSPATRWPTCCSRRRDQLPARRAGRATCSPLSTATTTPTTRSACAACSLPRPRAVHVIFPLHPRTRARIDDVGPRGAAATSSCASPVTYSEMLALERGARAIATDSGGVQREAYLWGVPCITLREETEWVETVETGWNTLVGVDPDAFRGASTAPRPARAPADLRRRPRRRADRRALRRRPRRLDQRRSPLPEQLRVGRHRHRPHGRLPRRAWQRLGVRALVAVADPRRRRRAARASRGQPVARVRRLARPARRAAASTRRGLDRLPLRTARGGRARRPRGRPARAGREADRDHAAGRPAHARRRARGGPQADGRPRRALQPGGRDAARALDDGRLGRVFRAHATRVGPLPARIRDAGVAIDLATHDLDVMQHLLGRQVDEVYADGGRFVHDTQEDMLTCLVRLRRAARTRCSAAGRELADARAAARAAPDRRERACCARAT